MTLEEIQEKILSGERKSGWNEQGSVCLTIVSYENEFIYMETLPNGRINEMPLRVIPNNGWK